MKYEPHTYQMEAVKFLLGQPYAGLLLDMGLGKTSITLYSIKQLMDAGHVKRVLLIAPIRPLYTVWPNEIKKWDDFKNIPYHNCHADPVQNWNLAQRGIFAINPESALAHFKTHKVFAKQWDLLVIDESSMFKNYASQRFKYLKPQLARFDRRWILTGTPAPNGLEDLWSQMYILDQGEALGKYVTHFRNHYCTPDRSGYGYVVEPKHREEIYKSISGLVLRMDAKDHLDMPELVYNSIPVRLPPAAMRVYKEMEENFITILESGEAVTSINAGVAGMRCRQIANGGVYLPDGTTEHIHMAKMDALKEIVEELQGRPLLVFYEFIHDQERIAKVFGDIPNLTTSKNPDVLVTKFNAGDIPVMIGHPATIGMGLNLQGSCSHICWAGIPWDLGLYDQANARVYRQGQEADRVIIHHLVAEGTVDVKVLKALAVKGRQQKDLLDAIQELRKRNS